MMNRTQLQILAGELKKIRYYQHLQQQAYETIADTLNARETVENPEPRGTVPARFTWDTFLQLLTGAQIWGMYAQGNFAQDLRRALESNSAVERNQLWGALKLQLPAAKVTEIETAFAATVPDPDWSPTVLAPSIAMTLGLPRVLPSDVQAVEQGVV